MLFINSIHGIAASRTTLLLNRSLFIPVCHCMEAHKLYSYQTQSQFSRQRQQQHHTMTSNEPTIASLERVSREQLSSQLLSPESGPAVPSTMAIIDVRDSDHVGGHIRGSTWIPASQLDYKMPELVRTLKEKEVVVFHCALSQQRGPSAALRYLREKRRLGGDAERKKVEGEGVEESEVERREEEGRGKEQRVVVLEGGFTEWQEKYGEDKRLTEAYQKDIWEFGY